MDKNNKQPSVRKNFFYSTAYQVFNIIVPLVTGPYISRVLGPEGIGIQSFTASNQAYFLLFAALGTMTYGAREISMNRDDPYKRSMLFWEIELMTVGTSLFSLIGWGILIVNSYEYRIYYEILTVNILASLFDITWFFQGMEEFRLTVIRNFIFRILGTVCLFLFIKKPDDLILYIIILSMTSLLSNLSLWPYMSRFLVKVNAQEFRFKRHFQETLVYFIPTIATSVYTVLDRTLIGLITHNMYENGYYQQAEKIISIAKTFVYNSLNMVLGVRMSYLYAEKKYDEIHIRIKNSMNYIFFMGVGFCFGIIGIARTFVPLFFGAGYEKVIPLLYLFSPITIIIGISNTLGSQYYTPFGKRAQSARYIIAGAIVNLCLNLVFIPKYASIGAAFASIIAEIVVTSLYIKYSDGYGTIYMLIKVGYKKVIAGIIMGLIVYSMNQIKLLPIMVVLLQVVVGILVYCSLLLCLNDNWTVDLLRGLFKRIGLKKR